MSPLLTAAVAALELAAKLVEEAVRAQEITKAEGELRLEAIAKERAALVGLADRLDASDDRELDLKLRRDAGGGT